MALFGLGLFQKKYVEGLEGEVTYWRAFAERERARADRLHDQLLQVSGCAPATETTIKAQEIADQRYREAADQNRDMLTELFADAVNEHADVIKNSDEADLIETIGAEVGKIFRG